MSIGVTAGVSMVPLVLTCTKCGYLEDLAELSEPAGHRGRPDIHGLLQIRVLAVFTWSVFIFSLFILSGFTWSLTCLRGCSCSCDSGILLDPQSLRVPIYVLTGLVMLVTQPFILVNPVLIGSRKLSWAVFVVRGLHLVIAHGNCALELHMGMYVWRGFDLRD